MTSSDGRLPLRDMHRLWDGTKLAPALSDLSVPETFELELNCALCGGPLTVQLEDWIEERDRLVSSAVACPFCAGPVTFESPGRILWAVPRVVAQPLHH